MNDFTKKIEESIKLIDRFREYYDYFETGFNKFKPNIVNELKHMIFDKYPEQRKKILDRVQALNIKAFTELSTEDQQKLIFQIYYLLKQLDTIIYTIYKIISDYSFENSAYVDSELSSTVLHNSINKEHDIKKYYNKFIKTYYEITEINVIEQFSSIIMMPLRKLKINDLIDNIIHINTLFQKYQDTIHLFSYIIQEILNEYSDKEYKYMTQIIMTLIEKDKALILQPTSIETKSQNGAQNPFLRNFGLIPSEEFKSIQQLFPDISISTIKNNDDKIFQQISKNKNINIILLQNITSNPISHELWKLINYNAHNLDHNENKLAGITEDLIEKTTTIKLLESEKNTWVLSSYKLFDAKSDNFYILETLNQKTYRFLQYWISIKDTEHKIPIHRSKIIGFLNYLGINGEIKELDRISMYQKLHEQSILNIFFHNKNPDIEKLITESQFQIDASRIKEDCWFNIKKIIHQKIKNIKKPIEQIGFIVHYSDVFDTFSSTILNMYNNVLSRNDDIHKSKFNFAEEFSSYLYELRKLRYEFIKSLHNEYIKKINDDIETIESINTKEQLFVYIENLIKKVLDDLISQEKNIYQSIVFKNNLFTIT